MEEDKVNKPAVTWVALALFHLTGEPQSRLSEKFHLFAGPT